MGCPIIVKFPEIRKGGFAKNAEIIKLLEDY